MEKTSSITYFLLVFAFKNEQSNKHMCVLQKYSGLKKHVALPLNLYSSDSDDYSTHILLPPP